jgi:protein-L-isoaspartate(D-aspartate) O-methyltransferase
MTYTEARTHMVEGQIRANNVNNPFIIESFKKIPQEIFISPKLKNVVYMDQHLSLLQGEYILKPFYLARFFQFAEIKAEDSILDIGCGYGYSTALLALLCKKVVGLTESEDYQQKGNETLVSLNLDHATIIKGPLAEGCLKNSPFQVIFINGMVESIPLALLNQLDPHGGRLITMKKKTAHLAEAVLILREGDAFSSRSLFEGFVPPLHQFNQRPSFEF